MNRSCEDCGSKNHVEGSERCAVSYPAENFIIKDGTKFKLRRGAPIVPKGYRRLKTGEKVKAGDFWADMISYVWSAFIETRYPYFITQNKNDGWDLVHIRKI